MSLDTWLHTGEIIGMLAGFLGIFMKLGARSTEHNLMWDWFRKNIIRGGMDE